MNDWLMEILEKHCVLDGAGGSGCTPSGCGTDCLETEEAHKAIMDKIRESIPDKKTHQKALPGSNKFVEEIAEAVRNDLYNQAIDDIRKNLGVDK